MERTLVRHCIVILAALTSLIAPAALIRADIAPPEQAPGSNIQPEGTTRVQMAAERVTIEVLRVKGTRNTGLPVANVVAMFTMRNTGNAPEKMTVRFPLSDPSGQGDGLGGHPEIEQVTVTVNGKRAPTRVITTPNPRGESEPPIRWAAFDVTFPADGEVAISVQYTLRSTGYPPYGRFKYILETGAGWYGPIGLASLVLKLPYEANAENVVLGQSTPGGTFVGDEVRWTFKDIEPDEQDNFYVTVLAPIVWERILEARRRTEAMPKSAAAWRELAQAYLSAIFGKYRPEIGENFIPLIEEAYRRAQENAPTSAQLHAEWAQVLLNLYPPLFNLDPAIAEKILAALKAAFERDPSNPLAQKVLSDMRDWLTQLAQSSGAEAETAKEQLEQLDRIARETGADRFAATPTIVPPPGLATATPTPPTTPEAAIVTVPGTPVAEPSPTAEAMTPAPTPFVSSSIVTSTTEAGAVITATTVSPATTTLTATGTADIVAVAPSTATEASATTIITTPGAIAPATGTVSEATAVAEATPPTPTAGATPAAQEAAATAPSAAQGTLPAIWLALLLTYIVGGAATYGIHSLMIRCDRERAAQHAEGQEQTVEQAPDSTTDQPSADL